MAMSEFETQKVLVMEQRIEQIENVLGQVIEELRGSKILKTPKKE